MDIQKLREIVKGYSTGTIQPSRLRVGSALLVALPYVFPPPATRERWHSPAATMERLFTGIPVISGPRLREWEWVHETHDGHELARGNAAPEPIVLSQAEYPDWRDAVGGDFV